MYVDVRYPINPLAPQYRLKQDVDGLMKPPGQDVERDFLWTVDPWNDDRLGVFVRAPRERHPEGSRGERVPEPEAGSECRFAVRMACEMNLPGGGKIWMETDTQRRDMLDRYAGRCGFEVFGPVEIDAVAQPIDRSAADKNSFFVPEVNFRGTLRVTDAEKFATALRGGFGKSRGLGYGLMQIRELV